MCPKINHQVVDVEHLVEPVKDLVFVCGNFWPKKVVQKQVVQVFLGKLFGDFI